MKSRYFLTRFIFMFPFSLICCFAAAAQTRTFVSGLGSDANPCTRISPCRSFQRAHDLVNVGGEVIAVDSAGYGPITITKSVSIIGDGIYAGVNTNSGNGITIATAGITVNLRSLIIVGLNSGTYGINASDFEALHIEACVISRFTSDGIHVESPPGPAHSTRRRVFIKNSISRNNGGNGLDVSSSNQTTVFAVVERAMFENNAGHGVRILGTNAIATVEDSTASGNDASGLISALGGVLQVERCDASNNSSGIGTNSIVRVSNSTVTNNTGVGFSNNNGLFFSRGNNTVAGNNGGLAQTDGLITPDSAK